MPGHLPSTWSNLSSLQSVNIGGNQISGGLTPFFSCCGINTCSALPALICQLPSPSFQHLLTSARVVGQGHNITGYWNLTAWLHGCIRDLATFLGSTCEPTAAIFWPERADWCAHCCLVCPSCHHVKLQVLDRCVLTPGGLPTTFSNLSSLRVLDIGFNKLAGAPASLPLWSQVLPALSAMVGRLPTLETLQFL